MWYEKIIAAHLDVTDQVSHIERIKSDRYFVWQEDGESVLAADDIHAECAITGTTDLFTKQEFDPWVDAFGDAVAVLRAVRGGHRLYSLRMVVGGGITGNHQIPRAEGI